MALNLHQKNHMLGAYKKKWKPMKKKKPVRSFWVRKFYHKNKKEREISEALLWTFAYSYNTTIAFLNIIACYSQQIRRIFSMVGLNFVKEWKSNYFIKNKIIHIHRFTLHSFFLCFLFWVKRISCIMLNG